MKLSIDNYRNYSPEQVLFHQMLNCNDYQNNKNKFYEIKLEIDKSKEYSIWTRHGRVGEEGVVNRRYFSDQPKDLAEAKKHYDKLIKSKEKTGYTEIQLANVTATKQTNKPKSKPDTPLERIITMFYEEAYSLFQKHVQAPLGTLSMAQLHKSQEILDDILEVIQSKKSATKKYELLVDLSSKLYSNLPQVSESRTSRLPVIDSMASLNKQSDLLEVMKSLISLNSSADSDAMKKYKATGSTLEYLEPSDPEWKRIEEYVKKSQGNNHNVELYVKNIFKTDVQSNKHFNPNELEVKELFHGTRSANMLSILQNGLLIKPKTAVHTGSMFGNGIYFADCSTKSSQYAHQWANNKYDTSFLFLCDVAVGKMKVYHQAQTGLDEAPKGYDSVLGEKGQSLIHNEYIVYNTNQSKIKYIIEFGAGRATRSR